MSTLGWVHTVFAAVAIATGGGVCVLTKGTRWHRTLGHVYATAMVGLLVTAFSIYDLFGSFGPFHVAGVVSTVSLAGGMGTVLLRRPRKNWMEHHATWMAWSYVGLIAAFFAETLTRFVMPTLGPRMPEWGWTLFWTAVAVGGFLASGVGWWVIKTRLPRSLERASNRYPMPG